MGYEHWQSKPDVEFKRLCGVKRHTVEVMRQALQTAEAAKTKPGRPGALRLEAPLLMTLLSWRPYRTWLPLGAAVGVSEGPASRRVRWLEDVLVKSGRFALPQRRTRFAAPRASGKWWRWLPPPAPLSGLKKTAPLLQRQAPAPHPEKPSAD